MKNLGLNYNQSFLGINVIDFIPKNNELLKMNEEMPWEEMIELIGSCYSNTRGARSKSIRMLTGLEIIKAKYGLPDDELVKQLQTNFAFMYFCGIKEVEPGKEIKLNSSTLTKFRNRLTPEILMRLQEIAIKPIVRKLPKRRINSVMADTTCFEENIAYPTDSGLLEKVIAKGTKVLEGSRKMGNTIIIRGKNKMKKLIRGFNLQRNKSKNKSRKCERN